MEKRGPLPCHPIGEQHHKHFPAPDFTKYPPNTKLLPLLKNGDRFFRTYSPTLPPPPFLPPISAAVAGGAAPPPRSTQAGPAGRHDSAAQGRILGAPQVGFAMGAGSHPGEPSDLGVSHLQQRIDLPRRFAFAGRRVVVPWDCRGFSAWDVDVAGARIVGVPPRRYLFRYCRSTYALDDFTIY